MEDQLFEKAQRIHFVGIGGIGMSALARMLHEDGKNISGSDRESTEITKDLQELGIEVFRGHDAAHISEKTDAVVYSPAIPEDNPERARAKELGITELSYPQALGLLSRDRFTIAVAGAHGKTTTTAMVYEVLRDTLSPTLIIGSLLVDTHTNFVEGKKGYLVVEACEYKRSFLELEPDILVITNIEADHLDYYKDLDDIKNAFNELVRKVPKDGFVVCNLEEKNVRDVLNGVQANVINAASFLDDDIELAFPAPHNIENASKAVAVSQIFDIPRSDALVKLKNFKGTWRRQESKGVMKTGAALFDDYAHHPTEIAGTLSAFKTLYSDKRIVVVFQPHLHSRTEHFFDDFVTSLKLADRILLAPVYEARAEHKSEFTSKKLARALSAVHNDVVYHDSFEEVTRDLFKHTTAQDVVILMGAGDLYTIAPDLVQ